MSGQHHTDRAKTKPGDLRAEVAQRVGLTAKEQALCRIEGWKMAMRVVEREANDWWFESWEDRTPSDVVGEVLADLSNEGKKRWGALFDATG